MSTPTQLPAKTDSRKDTMEFTPFGAADKIKLSIDIVKRFVAVPTKSGVQCDDAEAMRFMMMCQAQRLNPFVGDCWLVGYDTKNGPKFNKITAHQVFLKRAESHDDYEGLESGVIIKAEDGTISERDGDFADEGENVVGGWCRVHRKGKRPMYKRLAISQRKPEYPTQFWEGNKAYEQIVKCFDHETEVLTTRGFERFANAEGRILQVSASGLEPTDAVPFAQNYTGPMICFKNQNLDFCVTPNHDMKTDRGTVEAGKMFDQSNATNVFRVPRCVMNRKGDAPISDRAIQLAAIFLADGYWKKSTPTRFAVAVSRQKKIAMIEGLGGWTKRNVIECSGQVSESATRTIICQSDKCLFWFDSKEVETLVTREKNTSAEMLLKMSSRQAKLFCDTLIFCDGSKTPTGTRRFYSSRPEVIRAFELSAVLAGYCIGPRVYRDSDIGTKPNCGLTISEINEIPVARHRGKSSKRMPSLAKTLGNASGLVWCVTVPSGTIVVRRHGFSFVCHNCAEADALRSSFPNLLAGLRVDGETINIEASVVPNDVATREVAAKAGALPEQSIKEVVKSNEPTPQQQVEAMVIAERFTYDDLKKVGMDTGIFPDADTFAGFSEIPAETCKRLIRAKAGLINSLKGLSKPATNPA
jgi:RecT family